MKTLKDFVFVSLFVIIIFPATFAWADTTGAAEGYIKDAKTGEAIEKAKIILISAKSESQKHELYSDKKGHFYKAGLVPGFYTITIEKEGYYPIADSIRVRLGETYKVEIKLEAFSGRFSKSSTQGTDLLDAGKYEEAIGKFDEAIADSQADPLLYYYRALAFEKSGNTEKALEDYQKSIEMKPDFILPLSRLGIIYAKRLNFEKAIEFYQKAVDAGNKDATVFYNFGVCLLNLGKTEEARDVLEKLLSLDANYSDACYQLGILYLRLGETEKAKEFLQKFIEMEPDNKNASIAKEILKSLG